MQGPPRWHCSRRPRCGGSPSQISPLISESPGTGAGQPSRGLRGAQAAPLGPGGRLRGKGAEGSGQSVAHGSFGFLCDTPRPTLPGGCVLPRPQRPGWCLRNPGFGCFPQTQNLSPLMGLYVVPFSVCAQPPPFLLGEKKKKENQTHRNQKLKQAVVAAGIKQLSLG